MFDLDRLDEIWVTISRNKVRSVLTAFGVFWGIFMLVFMMGMGEGLSRSVTDQLEGVETNSCFMGTSNTSEPYKGFQKGRYWRMHTRDMDVVYDRIKEIDILSPILWGGRSENNIVYEENTGTFSVRGLHSNYDKIENQHIQQGRFLNELDIKNKRKVCVIGTDVYEELFPTRQDPIGKLIKVSGVYYQVIGVAAGNPSMSLMGRTSSSVILPFTTLQQINNQGDAIHMLAATAKPQYKVSEVEEEIKTLIRTLNNVSPTDKSAMWGFNVQQQFDMMKNLFIGIALIIWIVGSGTLIAGVVGVSNIMLVTVKERTREIGVRRALGAKPGSIIGQILSETLIITLLAGLLGLAFGVLMLHLTDLLWLQHLENVFLKEPMVSLGTAVWSSLILLALGLIAGMLPAARALQIKAIDAIREE